MNNTDTNASNRLAATETLLNLWESTANWAFALGLLLAAWNLLFGGFFVHFIWREYGQSPAGFEIFAKNDIKEIFYLFSFGIVAFLAIWNIFVFASRLRNWLYGGPASSLEMAFRAQRDHFRAVGVAAALLVLQFILNILLDLRF